MSDARKAFDEWAMRVDYDYRLEQARQRVRDENTRIGLRLLGSVILAWICGFILGYLGAAYGFVW